MPVSSLSASNKSYDNRVLVAHFDGFRPRDLRLLSRTLGNFGEAYQASASSLLSAGITKHKVDAFLEWRKDFSPERALQTLAKQNIHCIFTDSPDYPPLLKQTADPPEVLFYRGGLPNTPSISFVGSRKHSLYGQVCVNLLVPDAVRHGVTTVSGLALGIDALVHKKTLSSGGKTVAVLGTGIDDFSIYPRNHAWLAREIIENGGCLMSEFPPGTQGRKEHFPIRNRIIAGLSVATVIIEAGEKSGSLITARLALEENRDVFAVPGPITKPTSFGTNLLLKAGAQPCLDFASVLEGIDLDLPEVQNAVALSLPLNLNERSVISMLDEPLHVDEILTRGGYAPEQLCSIMSSLELKGLIQHVGGQTWQRTVRLPEEKKKCYKQSHHVKTPGDRGVTDKSKNHSRLSRQRL